MSPLEELTAKTIAAWNAQDVDAVVACYTEDCIYRDPNTRGAVEGRAALRKYLAKLFESWRMEWTVKETHLFADGTGGAFLWRADLSPVGTETKKRIHGMDLVVMRGPLIARNEVYFDRASLFT
jgi:ketosteroid isomerase-like protein